MDDIRFYTGRELDFQKILALYENAGWRAYTAKSEILQKAFENSLFILTAWSGEELVGFLRAVGDGLTIIYIQDIIVLESFRRRGIGKELLRRTLDKYNSVRQILLLTEEQPDTIAFYQSAGFQQTKEVKLTSFIKLNRG